MTSPIMRKLTGSISIILVARASALVSTRVVTSLTEKATGLCQVVGCQWSRLPTAKLGRLRLLSCAGKPKKAGVSSSSSFCEFPSYILLSSIPRKRLHHFEPPNPTYPKENSSHRVDSRSRIGCRIFAFSIHLFVTVKIYRLNLMVHFLSP